MWLVAPLPVGAPLAMSTLGAGARSLRAPAIPSISGRPCTLSKKGLDAALSAQICDLSEKVVFDCLETTTGVIHELFFRMLLEVGLSMRETAMASNPLKPPAAGKFAARLE